jgi:putative transposase
MKEKKFDLEAFKNEAKERLRRGAPASGKEGVFQPLLKQMLQEILQAEMDGHMEEKERSSGNRRNGNGSKKVKSTAGEFDLETPRDRNGTFEPQIVAKRQVIISEELEAKVLRLYSKGVSTRDICELIEDTYGFTLSATTLSSITDRVIPMIREWQQRPLESVYCFVWMDALHYKVREDGKVVSRAVYNILGVNNKGIKDLLGMYVSESEGARFWLQVLNDLKARGVEDILISSIDNLKGFKEAIETTFPATDVQSCIVHQIRNTLKYIPAKDSREFLVDLRMVYQALTKEEAEYNLDVMEDKWGKKYTPVFTSWRNNWEHLSNYFKYPEPIRRIMYTTNIIEGFHRQVRKITKTKGAFTSDMALLKLIYLATQNMIEKWTSPIGNWGLVASQLDIIFGERARITINSL